MEDRIIDLEIKFTFQEELLAELNNIVTAQQFKIDKLEKELKMLHSAIGDSQGSPGGGLKDEKPPHY